MAKDSRAVHRDLGTIKELVNNIRSNKFNEKKITISRIPNLILDSLKREDYATNQLLLVIYNLSVDSEKYEALNLGNQTQILGQLLRLYAETITDHQHEQIYALTKIIELVQSSELLNELAYALSRCTESEISKEDTDLVDDGLGAIKEKAAANLFTDTLLMIHSIMAMR